MAPATVTYYAEYPGNSGKFWAVPAEGDAVGWSYRKDWFEDPAEMEAFKAKYGYDLAVPQTWEQLLDIAEFFHRPDENRYGIAIYTDNSYDGLVMGVENALFSYGGNFGDYESYEVEGIRNSPENVAALEAYRTSTATPRRAGPRPSSPEIVLGRRRSWTSPAGCSRRACGRPRARRRSRAS